MRRGLFILKKDDLLAFVARLSGVWIDIRQGVACVYRSNNLLFFRYSVCYRFSEPCLGRCWVQRLNHPIIEHMQYALHHPSSSLTTPLAGCAGESGRDIGWNVCIGHILTGKPTSRADTRTSTDSQVRTTSIIHVNADADVGGYGYGIRSKSALHSLSRLGGMKHKFWPSQIEGLVHLPEGHTHQIRTSVLWVRHSGLLVPPACSRRSFERQHIHPVYHLPMALTMLSPALHCTLGIRDQDRCEPR